MKSIFLQLGIISLLICGFAIAQTTTEGTLQQLENSSEEKSAEATAPVKPASPEVTTPAPSLNDLNPNAPKVERPKKAGEENLLSFEEEVIEGEKKRPELFLDIKAGDGNLGSGLYKRSNFDDFFEVDRIRRPRFVKAK